MNSHKRASSTLQVAMHEMMNTPLLPPYTQEASRLLIARTYRVQKTVHKRPTVTGLAKSTLPIIALQARFY